LNYKCNHDKNTNVIKLIVTFVIVNIEEMKSRILKFLSSENKTSAQFAEEIGVQPSGVSHILSGRNNPSLDFVMKMLNRYPALSTEWLMFGREPMYKRTQNPTLFDELEQEEPALGPATGPKVLESHVADDITERFAAQSQVPPHSDSSISGAKLERIVLFYDDRSFRVYSPG
jgi:transcriptional regulator with XRE-family HTH domain